MDARRADALVAMCSARIASDADPDRATVVVHARLEDLASGSCGAEIEGGPVIHPETAKRLACNGRVQVVIEDQAGQPVALGRTSREPSAPMLRQIRYRDSEYRDSECRFTGCGARRFTQAHHIVWWERGGWTDLTTSSWCARSTTGWCTSTGGRSGAIVTAQSPGSIRTEPVSRRSFAAPRVGRTTTCSVGRRRLKIEDTCPPQRAPEGLQVAECG